MSASSVKAALQVALLAEPHIDTVHWDSSLDVSVNAVEVAVFAEMTAAGRDRADSNVSHDIFEIHMTAAKNLGPSAILTRATLAGIYMGGEMLEIQEVLLDPDFYDVTGVHEVQGDPVITRAEHVGNVVEFTISVQVSIT